MERGRGKVETLVSLSAKVEAFSRCTLYPEQAYNPSINLSVFIKMNSVAGSNPLQGHTHL